MVSLPFITIENVPSEAVVVETGSVETIPPPPVSVHTPPAPQFWSSKRTVTFASGCPCGSSTVPVTVVPKAVASDKWQVASRKARRMKVESRKLTVESPLPTLDSRLSTFGS